MHIQNAQYDVYLVKFKIGLREKQSHFIIRLVLDPKFKTFFYNKLKNRGATSKNVGTKNVVMSYRL